MYGKRCRAFGEAIFRKERVGREIDFTTADGWSMIASTHLMELLALVVGGRRHSDAKLQLGETVSDAK